MYADGANIGGTAFTLKQNTPSYTELTIPIQYYLAGNPDSAYITFSININNNTSLNSVGSYAIIDDQSFDGATDINEITKNIPDNFEVKQNYPNPFNPTTIEYSIPASLNPTKGETLVQLKIYDIIGNKVAVLVSQYQNEGTYKVNFNAHNLTSGIYIARFTADHFTKSFKMTLLK